MSHNASAHALRQLLPAMEKWLYFNLGDRADDWGGSIFLAYETLEEKCGMSRSTLRRTFKELIETYKLVEIEVEATPVSPPFYRMLGVPAPMQVRQQDDTCPHALRRAAIYLFEQRCEFCGRRGMKEWGPDGRPWQIVQLEPDKYAGRPTADNVTLACQTCARKKNRSLEGVRSLVVRQRERRDKSPTPSLFDETADAGDGRSQVESAAAGGGFNLTSPGGQVDPRVASTWREGGVKLNPPPPRGGVNLDPDPCTDPSNDPFPDPSTPEEAGATPRAPAEEDPVKNLSVITRIAHQVLDLHAETPDVTEAEIAESVKRHCAVLHIAYRSDVVSSAIDSALYQRRRAGKPSVLHNSSGEAAFRLQTFSDHSHTDAAGRNGHGR
jgi:hypothetical protein